MHNVNITTEQFHHIQQGLNDLLEFYINLINRSDTYNVPSVDKIKNDCIDRIIEVEETKNSLWDQVNLVDAPEN